MVQREDGQAADTGLLGTFRERAISLRTMSPRLRLVTGLAVAQIVVAAIMLALRGADLPRTTINAGSLQLGGLLQISGVALWVCVVLLAMAWTYVLVGAFHAHLGIRVVALALFTGATALLYYNSSLKGAGGVAEVVILAAIWVVGALWWRNDRRAAGIAADAPHPVRLMTMFALVLGLYGAFRWSTSADSVTGAGNFGAALFEQQIILAVFLIPVLLLAGSEFAEWGEVVGDRVAVLAGRARGLAIPASLLAVAAALALARAVDVLGDRTPSELVLGLLGAALVAAVMRGRADVRWPHAVPYIALAVAAVAFYAVSRADLFARQSSGTIPSAKTLALGGPLQTFSSETEPVFSIRYPVAWRVQPDPFGDQGPAFRATAFNGASQGFRSFMFVVSLDRAVFVKQVDPDVRTAIDNLLASVYPDARADLGVARPDGPWLRKHVLLTADSGKLQATPLEADAWERVVGGRIWVLLGAAPQKVFSDKRALFAQMKDAWRPQAAAESDGESAASSDNVPIYALGFWLLASLALAFALARRAGSPRSRTIGLFLLIAGLLYVLGGLREGVDHLTGGSAGPLHSLDLDGVQATAAAATLGWLGWRLAHRRLDASAGRPLAALLMLNIGIQVLIWMHDLYGGATALGGRFSLAQALVIFLALAWELTVSGVTITNGDSRVFPRQARVLLFCGYIILVAVLVLFFSSLHLQATGEKLEPLFESEYWVRLGIVQLGAPLLLAIFALASARSANARLSR
jgi:preprotein translocase subunit Sec61beta